MDSYGETHRKEMDMGIDRQNREWKLNERRKGFPRRFWDSYSDLIGIFLWCIAVILIAVLAIMVADAAMGAFR